MRIALDAMGGDRAPADIVRGAVQASVHLPEVEIILVGDRAILQRELAACNGQVGHRLSIRHCSQVIGMDESPVTALRAKGDSSIARCWEMTAGGEADAIVSAGNTGAVVAGSHFHAKYLPGIKRPGIAVAFPTPGAGKCIVMDVGANMKCTPQHLMQYGIMAAAYSERIMGVEDPTVGLLSVGEEDAKGNSLTKDAHDLLRKSKLNFIGNVEGRDIHVGRCDVVVCEGFVGNVILKVSEGLVSQFMRTFEYAALEQELFVHHPDQMQRLRKALDTLWGEYDYTEYGGAPLLGIDTICIICHGSSNARTIRNAVRVAHDFGRFGLNEHLVARVADATPQLSESNT